MHKYFVLLFCLLLCAPVVPAEDSGPDILSNRRLKRDPLQTSANIRVNTNEVLVPVSVLDLMGRTVTGLSSQNFRVLDGTEQRPIVSFGQEDAPIAIGLVYDCSRSMMEKFKNSRQAPSALFQQLNQQDKAMLITVSNRSELRQPFTSDFGEIENRLLFIHPTGTTALLDGVYFALSHMKKESNSRKAIVVVSDGGENNSRYSMRELASVAVESNTQIFSICFWENPTTTEEADGPMLLEHLSQLTGGVSYMVSNPTDLRDAMSKIGVTLHNQYVLGYYPPDKAVGGKQRKIKVELRLPAGYPKLQIYARNSYFVPEK